jgi:membrane protease YdiL (CAAX protease family)
LNEPGTLCNACGSVLRSSSAFCASCGLRVGESPPASAAAGSLPSVDDQAGWRALRPALQLFGAMLAVSFAGMIAYKFSTSPWIDVSMCSVDAVLISAFAFHERAALRSALGLVERPLPLLKTPLVLATSILLVSGYFALLERLGVPFVRYTDEMLEAGWPVWTAYLAVSIYPAVFEELAFRGIILRRLQQALGATEAWLVQAAMFSVLHLLPFIFPSHFVLGLVFGWLRLKSGSLYPGMIAHALWNAWVLWRELSGSG